MRLFQPCGSQNFVPAASCAWCHTECLSWFPTSHALVFSSCRLPVSLHAVQPISMLRAPFPYEDPPEFDVMGVSSLAWGGPPPEREALARVAAETHETPQRGRPRAPRAGSLGPSGPPACAQVPPVRPSRALGWRRARGRPGARRGGGGVGQGGWVCVAPRTSGCGIIAAWHCIALDASKIKRR